MQNDSRKLAIFGALPVLEAAVRHNSFTKAAREFGLTQSALSRRIQGLERDLGVVLFARRGRSITLTEDGARIAGIARKGPASNGRKSKRHLNCGCAAISGELLADTALVRLLC
jgi:hypothetical protein